MKNQFKVLPLLILVGTFTVLFLSACGQQSQIQDEATLDSLALPPTQVLVDNVNGSPGALFGYSVDIADPSADLAIVGAPRTGLPTNPVGSATIYHKTSPTDPWVLEDYLLSPSPQPTGEHFGDQVAITPSTAALNNGYAFVSATGLNNAQGAVFVYQRDASGNWPHVDTLVDNNGAVGDFFGSDLALNTTGTTPRLLVAASGKEAVFIYEFNGNQWIQTPNNPLTYKNSEGFGKAVALSEDVIFVGAPNNTVGTNSHQGIVHAFVETPTGWNHVQKIHVPTGAADDFFGSAISADHKAKFVAIGAPGPNLGQNDGTVYIFKRQGSTGTIWNQSQPPLNPAPGTARRFGSALALDGSGTKLFVGAPGITGVASHVFRYKMASNGTLLPSGTVLINSLPGTQFGNSLAYVSPQLLVGAPNAPGSQGLNQGNVHALLQ